MWIGAYFMIGFPPSTNWLDAYDDRRHLATVWQLCESITYFKQWDRNLQFCSLVTQEQTLLFLAMTTLRTHNILEWYQKMNNPCRKLLHHRDTTDGTGL